MDVNNKFVMAGAEASDNPWFTPYAKTPRLGTKPMHITEKLDGTNASVNVVDGRIVCIASKKRVISPGKQTDNYSFARWVHHHADQIVQLGDGYHAGEWVGPGIQGNRYKLNERKWFIFNTLRPADSLPECVNQVPLLCIHAFDTAKIKEVKYELLEMGSRLNALAVPEGVCIFDTGSYSIFKSTYGSTAKGKWAIQTPEA